MKTSDEPQKCPFLTVNKFENSSFRAYEWQRKPKSLYLKPTCPLLKRSVDPDSNPQSITIVLNKIENKYVDVFGVCSIWFPFVNMFSAVMERKGEIRTEKMDEKKNLL